MDRKKITEISETMSELHKSFDKFKSVLSSGPASHYFEQILDFYDAAMNSAKFKVGQTVYLNQTPEITVNKRPGWVGCSHFLILDAEAIVTNVSYYNGQYVYDLTFKNESWLKTEFSATGAPTFVEMPVTKKHTFSLAESFLSEKKSTDDVQVNLLIENQKLKEQVEALTASNQVMKQTLQTLKGVLGINS